MKLKAFTLVDLIVSMVISSITIAFVMAVLLIILKMNNNYKSRCEEVVELEKLRTLLTRDLEIASEVNLSSDAFICILSDKEVEYSFSNNMLIREVSSKLDTFKFTKLEFRYKKVNPKYQLINEIELIASKGNEGQQKFNLLLLKNYDAQTKMRLNDYGY